MLVTNQQSAKLPEPCIGSLHNPSALVAAKLAAIFMAPQFVVLSIRRNQFDSSFLEPFAQRVGVVAAVGYDALRLLPRTAPGARNADFCDRGFRKVNFTRGGTFQPNSQRKTFTVDQYHPLRTLAPLGFAEGSAPLFRRGEAAVQKGLIPLEQAVLIQRLQQRAPRIQPDALIFPLGPVLIPATSRKLPQF